MAALACLLDGVVRRNGKVQARLRHLAQSAAMLAIFAGWCRPQGWQAVSDQGEEVGDGASLILAEFALA